MQRRFHKKKNDSKSSSSSSEMIYEDLPSFDPLIKEESKKQWENRLYS